MKITYSWMNEFTPLEATPSELATRLTLAGLEVESILPVAPPFSGVVVGEVLECTRHPEADKLHVCRVGIDRGGRESDLLQIICGAANVRRGLKVAVATVGALLPGNVRITRAKLRGLQSNGMLCSARELGLGEEHDGIMELPDSSTIGRDVRASLDLDDTVLEVNATPNRGDCMSVFGIARDYAAAQDRRYLSASAAPVAASTDACIPVRIDWAAGCPVFASRVIRGVRQGTSSPNWMQERLRRVGLNPISPVVDVTNYVMTELGQPMHAYDLARLENGIVVRAATPGERITLLDGKDYELGSDFMVVADSAGAVGLAGIMGGQRSSINDSTTDVLLESAHFTPAVVAGRARRLGLFTEGAQRFERGVDPTLPQIALERASALLLEIAGGQPGPVEVTRGAAAASDKIRPAASTVKAICRMLGAPPRGVPQRV